MYTGTLFAIGLLGLSSLGFAEPIPAPNAQVLTCPIVTKTTTATCTGNYHCPKITPCSTATTTFKACGGPGPACSPGPTPTVTTTVDKGCTSPCPSCSYTSTVTACSVF